jgi:hypothetical protein
MTCSKSNKWSASEAFNKALKLARVARWTPSTGAASQYRAGFSRRLALRYVLIENKP